MRCVREHQEQEQQPDCAEKCGEEGRGAEKVVRKKGEGRRRLRMWC